MDRQLRIVTLHVDPNDYPKGAVRQMPALHSLDDGSHVIASVDFASDPHSAVAAQIPDPYASGAHQRHRHVVVWIIRLTNQTHDLPRLAAP